MRFHPVRPIFLAFCFLATASELFASSSLIKLFIVYSRDPSSLRAQDLEAGIVKVLAEKRYEASISTDAIPHRLDEFLKIEGIAESIILNQIRKSDPDYVIVHGSRAAEKFGSFDPDNFADWPLVFCGIPGVPEELGENFAKSTFLVDEFPLKSTIDLALELQPDLERIVFTGTSTKTQNRYRFQTIGDLEPAYEGQVVFKRFFDVPVDEIEEELVASSTKDAIIELEDLVDEQGNIVHPNAFFPGLHKKKKIPIYTFWYPTREYEVVGGRFFIEQRKGEHAGRAIVNLVEGKWMPDRMVVDSSDAFFFWEQLKKHDISASRLPEGSTVLNKPQLLTQRQRTALLYIGWLIVVLGIVILFLLANIRRRVRAERALEAINLDLQSKNELLEQLSRKQSEYLSIVTHDLKNPIGAIGSMCSLINDYCKNLEEKDKEELDTFIGFIHGASTDMLARIDLLLQEERLGFEGDSFKPERLNISDIIRGVLSVNAVNAQVKRIDVQASGPPEDFFAYADAIKIKEVFDNLISNGIKYSPISGRVRVSWGLNGDLTRWRFEVADEGPGFSEKDKALLFQRFQKLSSKPTGDELASGFGLYLIKRNIDMHGGDVLLNSKIGEGSVFTVEIPMLNQG